VTRGIGVLVEVRGRFADRICEVVVTQMIN
jgi:hypothetical protein